MTDYANRERRLFLRSLLINRELARQVKTEGYAAPCITCAKSGYLYVTSNMARGVRCHVRRW